MTRLRNRETAGQRLAEPSGRNWRHDRRGDRDELAASVEQPSLEHGFSDLHGVQRGALAEIVA